jgi:hypothetical protein
MNNTCTICSLPLGGTVIGTGNGNAHPRCYDRAHPPWPACTLYQVARGCSDPIIAAAVIAELVPPDVADKIVHVFNERLMKDWLRRCLCE